MDHKDLIGKRVEIPVHYDLWMRGARFGQVKDYRQGNEGESDYVRIKMDHPQVKRLVKVWRGDWQYIRVR